MCSSEDTIADKQSCTQTDRPTHHNTNNTLFPYRGQSNKIINLQICIHIAPRISHHNTMTITKLWQISNDHNEHTLVPTKIATEDSRLRPWNIISHTRGRGHSSGQNRGQRYQMKLPLTCTVSKTYTAMLIE